MVAARMPSPTTGGASSRRRVVPLEQGRDTLGEMRSFVSRPVDVHGYRPGLDQGRGGGQGTVLKPGVDVFRGQHDGHPRVNMRNGRSSILGQQGKALQSLWMKHTSKPHDASRGQRVVVGVTAHRRGHPFVPSRGGCGHPPGPHRFPEHGFLSNGFHASVDRCFDRMLIGGKPPSPKDHVQRCVVVDQHGMFVRRGDVPTWFWVDGRLHVQVLEGLFEPRSERKTTTHGAHTGSGRASSSAPMSNSAAFIGTANSKDAPTWGSISPKQPTHVPLTTTRAARPASHGPSPSGSASICRLVDSDAHQGRP